MQAGRQALKNSTPIQITQTVQPPTWSAGLDHGSAPPASNHCAVRWWCWPCAIPKVISPVGIEGSENEDGDDTLPVAVRAVPVACVAAQIEAGVSGNTSQI